MHCPFYLYLMTDLTICKLPYTTSLLANLSVLNSSNKTHVQLSTLNSILNSYLFLQDFNDVS